MFDFPGCCTAKVILDFGQTKTAEYGDDKYTEEEIEQYIIKQEKVFEMYKNIALLVAITNNEQTVAATVLKRLGFRCTRSAGKKQHPDTKIRLWFKSLND